MATVPTTEEIQNYIFDYIRRSGSDPRAGEIAADVTQLQMHLDRQYGVRAAEYETAVNGLLASDELSYNRGKFLKLTEKGFARL